MKTFVGGRKQRKPVAQAWSWEVGLSRYEHDSKVYPECSDEHIREMATANTRYAHVRRLHRVRLQPHQSPISQEENPTGQPYALGRSSEQSSLFRPHLPLETSSTGFPFLRDVVAEADSLLGGLDHPIPSHPQRA
jgi:hypothetical protein